LTARIIHGDSCKKLASLANASVSLVLCDPPYPCVPKSYGVWTEEEWFDLMNAVVPECRRVLKPHGSMVVILQPNSAKAGRMRLWLYEFIATWGRKWNLVQDCYQWNFAALPFGAATTCGLMRSSVKHCVWFGSPDCYRDQGAVLQPESDRSKYRRSKMKPEWATSFTSASASRRNSDVPRLDSRRAYAAAERRGGVTPFNLIRAANTKNPEDGNTHPARTSEDVTRFWIRYLTKPGDVVLDPFAGSGTTLFVANEEGRSSIGIEQNAEYVKSVKKRMATLAEQKRA
jgi:DNA modification methylase